MDSIQRMREMGQSVWLDDLNRELITSGQLAAWIDQGLTGLTTNPTIIARAITRLPLYQAARAMHDTTSALGLCETFMLEDVGRAADLLAPVYTRTSGADGYLSLEVPATLADDTRSTVQESRRLWERLQRPNIMIKVPATEAGLPAIAELIAAGVNVNATLILHPDIYRAVLDAYCDGLAVRKARRQPLDAVASVVSVFISRIDAACDPMLVARGYGDLAGRVGLAVGHTVYAAFQSHRRSAAWPRLRRAQARLQRPLWASTSPKNSAYPDLLNVDGLIERDTVATVTTATWAAIGDHGRPSRTLHPGSREAQTVLAQAGSCLDFAAIADGLLHEGVARFRGAYTTLLG